MITGGRIVSPARRRGPRNSSSPCLAQRQRHLATAVQRLVFLLDTYGPDELRQAVDEALDGGSPHPETVRLVLERRRQRTGQPPPITIPLSNPRLAELDVEPHDLADYDPTSEDDDEEAP